MFFCAWRSAVYGAAGVLGEKLEKAEVIAITNMNQLTVEGLGDAIRELLSPSERPMRKAD
jgi:lipid A disaccharide synthetase